MQQSCLPHAHPALWPALTARAMRNAARVHLQQPVLLRHAGYNGSAPLRRVNSALAALRFVGLTRTGLSSRSLERSTSPWRCSVCNQQLPALFGDSRRSKPHCAHAHSGIGGGNGNGRGWGGGGGRGDGGGASSGAAAAAAASLSPTAGTEEVVLLDVTGMKCAGCVSRVKDLLEKQPPVLNASVNLATETAMVRVRAPEAVHAVQDTPSAVPPTASAAAPGAGVGPAADLEQGVAASLDSGSTPPSPAPPVAPPSPLETLGASLAAMLTAHGFKTTMRDQGGGGSGAAGKVVAAKRAERLARLKEATRKLALAWVLASACLVHHLVHALGHAAPAWLHLLGSTPVHAALSALALLGPGRSILADGFRALSHGAPDMNSLVGLGAGAAFGISAVAALAPQLGWRTFFEEPAMLLGVVLIGRALEERAKLQASADMAALQGLLPLKARLLLGDGSWREVPSESVAEGDVITVLPGDRVPVDGDVVGGRSTLDESALTGEALPVTKVAGDRVTAGTMNYDGQLTIRAVHSGGDTAVADIVRLVEAAQARTAPVQRLADKVAGKFTYGVMAAAAATFIFWAGAGTRIFPQVLAPYAATASKAAASLLLSLQMACNVLVVACPCALGLAAPTAVLVGTGAGARRGLLIRGGDILEAASHVDTVVFDKTGTLTSGRPTVVAVRPLAPAHAPDGSPAATSAGGRRHGSSGGGGEGLGAAELLALAAAVEERSTHPIARAIAKAAKERGAAAGEGPGNGAAPAAAADADVGSFTQEPGSGVTACVGGRQVSVGTLEWVTRQQGQQAQRDGATQTAAAAAGNTAADGGFLLPGGPPRGLPQGAPCAADLQPGHILVYVGVDGQLAGSIEVSDELRPEAASTVAALRRMGVQPIMLSGDAPATALAMAAAVGIPPEDVFAGVKPAGKAAAVAALQERGKRVAMVGDGVNDAAALAQADVGIAMGGGVDAASEVADIVLLGDRVPQVLDALQLSRATLRKISQNMWWAFGYNLVGIPLAAGALLPLTGVALTPSISGAMMGVSSLAVMANSLLLQFEGRGGALPAAATPAKSKAAAVAAPSGRQEAGPGAELKGA